MLDTKKKALVLNIHESVIPEIEMKLADDMARYNSHIDYLGKEFGLGPFFADMDQDFGFRNVIKRGGKRNGFRRYKIPIPSANDRRSDADILHAISASLTALTDILSYLHIPTDCAERQLLIFETGTRRGIQGGAIWGEVSKDMADHLMSHEWDEESLTPVVRAMLSTCRKIAGRKCSRKDGFTARISKGGFVIDCPGNRCGLNPEDFNHIKKSRGYEFSYHNVDNEFQQLLLLAGLAALCDLVRKQMRKTRSE